MKIPEAYFNHGIQIQNGFLRAIWLYSPSYHEDNYNCTLYVLLKYSNSNISRCKFVAILLIKFGNSVYSLTFYIACLYSTVTRKVLLDDVVITKLKYTIEWIWLIV